MAEWLSDEWAGEVMDAANGRPPAPGVDGRIDVVITGGPQKELRLSWDYRDGIPKRAADLPAGTEALVTFTMPAALAKALYVGEYEPSVAFMRGELKTAGDPGAVLAWLSSTATPEWQQWRQSLPAAVG